MDTKELRATALGTLLDRVADPASVIPPAELEQLRVIFTNLDADEDGRVSAVELREAFTVPGTAPFVREAQVEHMIGATDIDGDGQLSFDELVKTSLRRKLQAIEERAWLTFAGFDVDGDGIVDTSELELLTDADASSSLVAGVLSAAIGDDNNEIDYPRFLEWYIDRHF